jgi:hypothetical protein
MQTAHATTDWTYSILIDDDAVEHCRSIGAVPSAEGHEVLVVEVVQRDQLGPNESGSAIDAGPAEVLVAGIRVTSTDARRLAHYLHSAADVAAAPTGRAPA